MKNILNSNTQQGIRISSSSSNLIKSNSIGASGVVDLEIISSEETQLIDQVLASYSLQNSGLIIKNSLYGVLKFLNTSMTETGENLSADIQVSNNLTFVNSSAQPGFNTSAEITLEGISFAEPQVIVDFNDDSVFEVCSSPQCNNLSYDGSTFVFNVSS